MSPYIERSLNILLRVVISSLAIWVVMSNVDFSAVRSVAGQLQYWALVLVIPTSLGTIFLNSWRLKVLHPEKSTITVWNCFRALMLSMLFNIFLPLRGGDIVRCAALQKFDPKTNLSQQAGIYGIEKVLELLSTLAVLGVWAVWSVTTWQAPIVLVFFFIALTLFLFVFTYGRNFVIEKIVRPLRFPEKIVSLFDHILMCGERLKHKRDAWKIIALTLLIRCIDGVVLYTVAMMLDMPLGFSDSIGIAALLGVAMAIPAAPGFIGTFEAAVILGLTSLGIDKSTGLTYALILHTYFVVMWLFIGSVVVLTVPKQMIKARSSVEDNI